MCFLGHALAVGALPARSVRNEHPDAYLVLYSWHDKQDNYYFALIPVDREQQFLQSFKPHFARSYSFRSLKRTLSQVPRGSLIVWLERPDLGLRMPPSRDLDKVIKSAKARNLTVELNPTLDERM
jgi:hypothetical protein